MRIGAAADAFAATATPPESAAAPGGTVAVYHDTLSVALAEFTSEPDEEGIAALLSDFAAMHPPLSGSVAGIGVLHGQGVAFADCSGMGRLRAELCEALDAAGYPTLAEHDFIPHLTGDADAASRLEFSALTFTAAGGERRDYPLAGEASTAVTAAAAGLAPLFPPGEWFAAPRFDGPTPLTVTDEGRVYGHFAPFGVCHTGRADACLDARQLTSATGYSYFNTGYVRTAEGSEVAVGRLTMDTGHAPITAGARDTISHYDDTGTVIADVRAGDDQYGQWIVGALRPDVPAEKVRALRAASPSGDWRPINARNELVAILAVNVPGYPLPRPEVEYAVAASGEVVIEAATGLAAGYVPPTDEAAAARRLAAMRASLDGLEGLRALLPA